MKEDVMKEDVVKEDVVKEVVKENVVKEDVKEGDKEKINNLDDNESSEPQKIELSGEHNGITNVEINKKEEINDITFFTIS